MKRLITICGSVAASSEDGDFLNLLTPLSPEGTELSPAVSLLEIPLFEPRLKAEPPEVVTALRTALEDAAGVVIATPEYAQSLPGALKNAFDWLEGSMAFYRKPTALVTVVPDPRLGQKGLAATSTVLEALSAHLTFIGPVPPNCPDELGSKILKSVLSPPAASVTMNPFGKGTIGGGRLP